MRGAMCPFDCPFCLAEELWARAVRRAACSLAHCVASSRASSSDAGTPVVAAADTAGASSTAVMMNSLRFGTALIRPPVCLAFAETGQRRPIHSRADFLPQAATVVGQSLGGPGPA